jgi:hypothetical protein
MKKHFYFTLLMAAFLSCSKSSNDSNPNGNSVGENTIIINDNGKTYTSSGKGDLTGLSYVYAHVIRENTLNDSYIGLQVAGADNPIYLNLPAYSVGQINGIGKYLVDGGTYFVSGAAGGYVVDSGYIQVQSFTPLSNGNYCEVSGTLEIYVTGVSESHKITGTFNCKKSDLD